MPADLSKEAFVGGDEAERHVNLQPALSAVRVEVAPVGLMKRSYFGGFRVKAPPTNVTFVSIRFHCFFCRLPLRMTLNISSSAIGRTCHSAHDQYITPHAMHRS